MLLSPVHPLHAIISSMKRVLPIVALTGLLLCGCARSSDQPRVGPAASPVDTSATAIKATPTESPMQTETIQSATKPPDGPVLTPEQVWNKLFALIESLHSEADLNKAHIERVIGLPLAKQPESNVSEYIAGDTTAGWRYAFDLLTYHDKDIRMAVMAWAHTVAGPVAKLTLPPYGASHATSIHCSIDDRRFGIGRHRMCQHRCRIEIIQRFRCAAGQDHADHREHPAVAAGGSGRC